MPQKQADQRDMQTLCDDVFKNTFDAKVCDISFPIVINIYISLCCSSMTEIRDLMRYAKQTVNSYLLISH